MTVTTGGRSASCVGSTSSSSTTSPSTERISTSTLNLSATSLAAVGSRSSLTVAITPSSSSALMTSPDLRRIFSASSPTVTDSGTRMSSRLTSTGGAVGSSTTTGATAAGATGTGAGAGTGGARGATGTAGRLTIGAAGWGAGRGGGAGAAGRDGGRGPDRLRLHDRRRRLDVRRQLLLGFRLLGPGSGFLRERVADRRGVCRLVGHSGLRHALGLRRLRKIAALSELHAQRVREHAVEGTHGPDALVAHLLGGDHQVLAGYAELLGEL